MFVLNQDKWVSCGFKMTPDKTLAWIVVNNRLIYVRPYDDANYGGTERPGEQASVVGKIYTLTSTNEQVAIFIGNDPFAVNDAVSFDESILPEDARYEDDIYSTDKAAALMVPFNRANKGYIPIVWNLGSKESICNINASIENIRSVYQLEIYYPSVDLPEQASMRYMVIEMRDMHNQLFGYNRNHLAYNGRLEDASQDYPLACNIYLSAKNREIPNEDDGRMTPPINPDPYKKSEGFNGKANGLLGAAALAGAARK